MAPYNPLIRLWGKGELPANNHPKEVAEPNFIMTDREFGFCFRRLDHHNLSQPNLQLNFCLWTLLCLLNLTM